MQKAGKGSGYGRCALDCDSSFRATDYLLSEGISRSLAERRPTTPSDEVGAGAPGNFTTTALMLSLEPEE